MPGFFLLVWTVKQWKVLPGLPAWSVEKVPTKSPNTDFDTFVTLFRVLWTFSAPFVTLRVGRPVWDFLGDFGLGGLETPVL